MMSYVNKLQAWLKEIEDNLYQFISSIRIKEIRSDQFPGMAIIIYPYIYQTDISEELKKIQIHIKKIYYEWEEHFTLLTMHLSSRDKKEINKSTDFIKKQIELQSSWATKGTPDENINLIKERFKVLYETLKLFEGKGSIVFILDTNSLIKTPDFIHYKELIGDKITILLIPTVLSELDKLKIVHRDEKFRNKVESVINRVKGYRKQGSLLSGVTSNKTITVKNIATEPIFEKTLSWLDRDNNDDRIIANAIEYQVNNPSDCVYIITSDINLQNKAEMAKLPYFETPVSNKNSI